MWERDARSAVELETLGFKVGIKRKGSDNTPRTHDEEAHLWSTKLKCRLPDRFIAPTAAVCRASSTHAVSN